MHADQAFRLAAGVVLDDLADAADPGPGLIRSPHAELGFHGDRLAAHMFGQSCGIGREIVGVQQLEECRARAGPGLGLIAKHAEPGVAIDRAVGDRIEIPKAGRGRAEGDAEPLLALLEFVVNPAPLCDVLKHDDDADIGAVDFEPLGDDGHRKDASIPVREILIFRIVLVRVAQRVDHRAIALGKFRAGLILEMHEIVEVAIAHLREAPSNQTLGLGVEEGAAAHRVQRVDAFTHGVRHALEERAAAGHFLFERLARGDVGADGDELADIAVAIAQRHDSRVQPVDVACGVAIADLAMPDPPRADRGPEIAIE